MFIGYTLSTYSSQRHRKVIKSGEAKQRGMDVMYPK